LILRELCKQIKLVEDVVGDVQIDEAKPCHYFDLAAGAGFGGYVEQISLGLNSLTDTSVIEVILLPWLDACT
jgi:hypothetical protein